MSKAENGAMSAVRKGFVRDVDGQLFERLWEYARVDGNLSTFDSEQFLSEPDVREEAVGVMEEYGKVALLGQNVMLAGAGPTDGTGSPKEQIQEFLRRSKPTGQNADGSGEPDYSTALRSEAMSVLMTVLAGRREDVTLYRKRYLGGRLLDTDEADSFIDGLQEGEKASGLFEVALDLCGCFGVDLGQAVELVLSGAAPSLDPVIIGRASNAPSVYRMHLSFAPWASPRLAESALREVQIREARLRSHEAFVAKEKNRFIARQKSGNTSKADQRRPWLSDDRMLDLPLRPDIATHGGRVRDLDDRSVLIFLFVEGDRKEHGKRSWKVLCGAWNGNAPQGDPTSPRRGFKSETSFSQAYRRSRETLMHWLPDPPPRLDDPGLAAGEES